ncbi:MAG: hypothetical protein P0S94_00880 [Simkaniaceae bacterium]|nr:hypothetical protein [Simkaniaceae bacterium]
MATLFLTASDVETLVYDSVTDGKSVKTTWTVEEKGTSYIIKATSDVADTNIECGTDYTFNKFKESDKKTATSYEVDRDGKLLKAIKIVDGKKVVKEFGAYKYPWIQEFNFGLKPFVRSTEKSYKFCILSPDKINLHNMIAERLEEEEIDIEGKKTLALKIKVTLQGFKSMFWKGTCWFDPKTAQMLRYEANSGPKTPVVTTTLLSTSTASSL